MADHDTHDHTGVPGAGAPTEILDIPTAETDTALVLAPDGAGGVEFRAESGGGAGAELGYVQITSPASITATVEASADTVVSAGSLAFDGGAYMIRFQAPFSNPDASGSGRFIALYLFDGSTSLGRIHLHFNQAASNAHANCSAEVRVAPSAGNKTYSIRGIVSAGTGTIGAGPGGAAADTPAFIRITKV